MSAEESLPVDGGLKQCAGCQQSLPANAFRVWGAGRSRFCDDCLARQGRIKPDGSRARPDTPWTRAPLKLDTRARPAVDVADVTSSPRTPATTSIPRDAPATEARGASTPEGVVIVRYPLPGVANEGSEPIVDDAIAARIQERVRGIVDATARAVAQQVAHEIARGVTREVLAEVGRALIAAGRDL